MQVKANLVIVAKPDGTNQTFENVNVIQGGNGLFIEHEVIIGKDNEGNDLKRNTFTLYPWEKVSLMEWNEPTLIEQVKEFVILTELEDCTDLLEELQDEMDAQVEGEAPKPKTDNPYES